VRIVLVSSGHAAKQFASELSKEHDVYVVHDGEEGREELESLDVHVVEGEGNDPAVLQKAGAFMANFVIACTRSDESNILACMTARQLGPAQTICFVTKAEYVRTFATHAGTHADAAPRFGIDRLVWPARMLADKIEKILTVPGATDVGSFARGQVALLEYILRDGLPLIGSPLRELRTLPPGVLIVGVRRGDDWFVPRGDSVLLARDRVLFMGRSASMHQLAGWFTQHLGEEKRRDVVIVGGGTVGFRVAQSMERNPASRLKLIEQDGDRCAEISQALERTLVLHADGCDIDLLESEQVHRARALVAVTDSDEKNLLASLLGRQLSIPKIVTRVTSASNRRVFERVGIDVPLSARGAAIEAVLHMIHYKEVDLLATIGGGLGDVLDVTLPETFAQTPLKDLPLPPDSIIAAIIRGGEALVPGGATVVQPGDHCLLICKAERLEEVRQALLG